MNRLLFAALALAWAMVPAWAISTTRATINATWQSICDGPCRVQTLNDTVVVAISDAAPAASDGGFVLENRDARDFNAASTSHVWVRALQSNSQAVVAYAPIVLGSGGGSGSSGGAVYGPTAAGSAPTQPPVLTALLDAAGNIKTPVLDAANRLLVTMPDIRATGTFSAAANTTFDIPLNGTATAGFRFSSLTASGATLSFSTTNDGGTTFSSKNTVNCGTGNGASTYSADGQPRLDVSGATGLRVTVSSGGTGNISYAYNLSSAPLTCPNGPTPSGTNPIGSITNASFGISGTLPAFASTPAFTLSGTGSVNNAQWAGVALGSPTTYGTAPTGNVPGVNAFVTNFPATQAVSWSGQTVAATQSGAWTVGQGTAAAATGTWPFYLTDNTGTVITAATSTTDGTTATRSINVRSFGYLSNGTSWDRWTGTGGAANVSLPKGATWNGSAVSVGTTATQIAAASTAYVGRFVTNNGTATMYLGASGVTVTNGEPLAAGAQRDFSAFTGALYGIVASGTADARLAQY